MSLTGVVNSSSGFSPTFAAELRERSDEDLERIKELRLREEQKLGKQNEENYSMLLESLTKYSVSQSLEDYLLQLEIIMDNSKEVL